MRRLIVLLMGILLLGSLSFAMSAQEAPPGLDEETIRQTTVMDKPAGAEMRLMQLESSMERNVIMGQKALETVLEKNPEADKTELKSVVAELETIKEEIEEKLQSGVVQEKNQSELVEDFLTFKEEGKNLTNEFRKKMHEYLDEEERQQVREEARQRASEELEEKRENIKKRIREHNAEQVEHVLNNFGVENETLVQQVRAGEINTGQAISQVARKYRGLGEDEKHNAKLQIKSERAQRNANAQRAVEKGNQGLENRMNQRANERLEEVREKLQEVRERVKNNVPEHVREKISKRMGPPEEVPRGPESDHEEEEETNDENQQDEQEQENNDEENQQDEQEQEDNDDEENNNEDNKGDEEE